MAAGVQKFCLRWNDFQGLVTSAFDGLRREEELVDVTLCCEGKIIKAHKMMLSACSPYFKQVLKDNPCKHPVFFMKDVKYSDMASILDFVYTGEVNVAQNNLSGFLKTAEALQVRGLTDENQGSRSASSDVTSTPVPCYPAPTSAEQTPPASTVRQKRTAPQAGELPLPVASSPTKRVRLASQSSPSPDAPPSQEHAETEPAHVLEQAWAEEQVKVEAFDEETGELDDTLDNHDTMDGASPFQASDALPGELLGHSEVGADASMNFMPDLSAPDDASADVCEGRTSSNPSSPPATLLKRACPVCGKLYRHRQSLHRHVQMHRGRTRCHICGHVLAAVESLVYHLKSRHNINRDQIVTLPS